MLFSGKITNSVLLHLSGQGLETEEFLEASSLPIEFLKDPTSWLEANKVEELLQSLEQLALMRRNLENSLQTAGHSSKSLKAWGVLDSVLRMIEKPADIFMQPQRFISYFISPAPPIANIQRGLHSVSFDLPISYEEFPKTASYLCAAIESVTLYMGLPMAEAHWQQNRVTVSWDQSLAQTIFGESELAGRQIAPDVFNNLISTLERTELALVEKTRELERIKDENAMAARSQPKVAIEFGILNKRLASFQNQICKLQDYFTRSQQLITLLVAQGRMNPQVREAMKRVGWEQVQQSYAETTKELLRNLRVDVTENTNDKFKDNFTEIIPTLNSEEFKNERIEQDHSSRDSGQSWFSHS